jgi:hypothetical protein
MGCQGMDLAKQEKQMKQLDFGFVLFALLIVSIVGLTIYMGTICALDLLYPLPGHIA